MLTTKKFVKEVEKLGFSVEKGGNGKYLWIKNSRKLFVAFVDTTEMYVFDTAYNAFDELQESDKKNLFNLLVKYTSTPHDEREEPQRFYLKFDIKSSDSYHYLNYKEFLNSIELHNKVNNLNGYKTQFTQKEVDELKKKLGVTFSNLKQIPVEEDEEIE